MSSTQQLLLGEGAGGGAAPVYIEDVFSTWVYTGNGASGQSIVNGIDLSTKGGLVWLKSRTTPSGSSDNNLYDTVRGASQLLISNSTNAQTTATRLSFQTTGFNLTNEASSTNESGVRYVSWTFREQPKFFDIVTYTGNGSTQNIAHNLGSVPGCIIVKRLNNASNTGWPVYHRYDYTRHGFLNTTDTFTTAQEETWFGNNLISVAPTSTVFTVGSNQDINANTNTYVAYIFAHNAGGFGLTGTDNVISCGSYTGNGSTTGPEINPSGDNTPILTPDSSQAEDLDRVAIPTSTGFRLVSSTTNYNGSGDNYIYIAIRRGPMKVPTSGTSVFTPVASRSSGTSQSTPIFNAGFPVDWLLTGIKAGGGSFSIPRLTVGQIGTATTDAETSASATYNFGGMLGILSASGGDLSNATVCGWNFRRAPSFFDVVCYTGTGTSTNVTHNLGAVPEMMIVRNRNIGDNWVVYHSALGNATQIVLNEANASGGSSAWNSTTPTSAVFRVGTSGTVNGSGRTYVAYLFATCAGVSKVGSYTGTGALQTVNCGFTSGARFVLIKRTNSTGDWWLYDSARGITSGNDPYVFLNSTAAEVTNTNYVDTDTTGFKVTAAAPAGLNASGGTYIFLAIA